MSFTQFRVETDFLTPLRIIDRKINDSVEGVLLNVHAVVLGKLQKKLT